MNKFYSCIIFFFCICLNIYANDEINKDLNYEINISSKEKKFNIESSTNISSLSNDYTFNQKVEKDLLTNTINNFAFNFYKEISDKENIFFSPFSIFLSLITIYEGSDGNTKKEIEKTLNLNLNKEFIREYFSSILKSFNIEKENIKILNSIWLDTEYSFLTTYIELLEKIYYSQSFNINYKINYKKAVKQINEWARINTNNKIDEIIPSNQLSSSTTFIISNIAYFNNLWEIEFDIELTYSDFFEKNEKEKFQVNMMRYKKEMEFEYYTNNDIKIVKLPYKNKSFSMYILLPNIDIKEAQKALNMQNFNIWKNAMSKRKLKIFLPKLNIESTINATEIISQMGLKNIFTKNSNFSLISNSKYTKLEKIYHKAYIDITEEGLRKSDNIPQTGIKSSVTLAQLFKINKPFILIIKDEINDIVLFIGKVSNPGKL